MTWSDVWLLLGLTGGMFVFALVFTVLIILIIKRMS